jgi:hypothetical protein
MNIIWGIILIVISGFGYAGQVFSTFWPDRAMKLGLTEVEDDVDPTFYADVRGEAYWDTATLWTLPAAGLLLVLGSPMWAYLGLIGGGIYLYFAGRGIFVRKVMQRRNIRIGNPEALKMIYVFLTLWGLVAVFTIVLAIVSLPIS